MSEEEVALKDISKASQNEDDIEICGFRVKCMLRSNQDRMEMSEDYFPVSLHCIRPVG